MGSKVNPNEKIISGIPFRLNFPIIFICSVPNSMKVELVKRFFDSNTKRFVGLSKRLKADFLKDRFSVKNEQELLKNNKEISKRVRELRAEIMNWSGLDVGEFPEWQRKKLQQYMEEHDKNKK